MHILLQKNQYFIKVSGNSDMYFALFFDVVKQGLRRWRRRLFDAPDIPNIPKFS